MMANTDFLGESPIRKTFFHTTYGKKFCTQFSIIVVGAKTDWRGNFSYRVLKFPFGIAFSPRKGVFEPI
jgi:hypothetical protein